MNIRNAISVLALVILFSVIPASATSAGEPQKITIEISGMNYSPNQVDVKKGVPVELTFIRDDKPTCGGTILFPDLGIEREVAAGQSVTIEFTPEKSGELTFTCGMKMMKGKIVVRND